MLTGAPDPRRISHIGHPELARVVAASINESSLHRYPDGTYLRGALREALEPRTRRFPVAKWMAAAALVMIAVAGTAPWFSPVFFPGFAAAPSPVKVKPAVPVVVHVEKRRPAVERVVYAKPSPAPEASPAEVTTPSGPMLRIEGGRFRMGYNGGRKNEQPEHFVLVKPFYLDQYEVTSARFAHKAGDTPAIHMTWYDADRYCRGIGERLPSEAEWEFAARGPRGFLYPWGNRWRPDAASVQGDAPFFGVIAPVGAWSQDRSPLGIYDMLGNAPEWIADDYLPYGSVAGDWPDGRKTVRGAGITYTTDEVRLTVRDSAPPDRTGIIGFRCAASADRFLR